MNTMVIIGIFDNIDCSDCASYRFYPGRTWGDPDQCYPPETICEKAAVNNPCERMLDALHEVILDGQLETNDGYFIDRDWAKQIQQGDTDCDVNPEFLSFDFSSAPYFFIPNSMNMEHVKPFENIKEVYNAST